MSHIERLADLVAEARKAGADAADAVLVASTSLSVGRRGGVTEQLERSEGLDLGLRVFLGRSSAIVSATSVDPDRFAQLAARAVAMARVVPEDPHSGLAEAMAAPDPIDLQLDDGNEPDAAALLARADAADQAARALPGITNTEGGEAGYSRSEVILVTSAGFAGRTLRSSHSVQAVALAGAGTDMQRDYDYSTTVFLAELEDAEAIGRAAAERALARLHPTRPRTAKLPVVFDPRVSASLLGSFASMINGSAVARGTSLLKDRMGQRVFAPGITITDDPRRLRGLRSKAWDGEGVPTQARHLVEDGVLTSWVLDSRTARQLNLASTGHASRGTSGPPSPATTNLFMAPGPLSPAALMADIAEGLYVTELMGGGMNGVTGDYSRGAAGFMIRHGQLAEPVAEITIAGSGLDMFANLTPASDLRFRRGTDAPTIRVEGLTMAGA